MDQLNENILRKSRKQRAFTQIDNEIINNENLSWQAKGLMAYLLSKPDDWKFYESDIVKRAKNGPDSVKSIIKELLAEGYLKRGERLRDEKGHLRGYNYLVEPYLLDSYDGKSYIGKSNVGKSNLGKTYVGKSNDSNTNSSNTKSISNTNSNNTNNNQPDMDFVRVKDFYESNFSLVSPIIGEMLGGLVDDFDTDLVLYAFEITALNPKVSNPMRYATSILNGWQKNLVTTRKQAEIYESNKRGEQNGQNNRGSHASTPSKDDRPRIFGDYCSD